ncbi:MAG TPA: hypothetical protein VGX27_10000 [Candidatus Dormibacteraeota bacterium]|nr:hypothetical protein [Candidatus Dormibacteraeota bacterium]
MGGRETDLDRIRELAYDLQRDMGKLVDIRGRLSLYEPPAPLAAEPPLKAVAPATPSINVTIHHVGQLNLAELLQHAEARIKVVDRRGDVRLAEALQQLTDAISSAGEAAQDQREDALDAMAVLAEVGALPESERGKMGRRVRVALKTITELANTVPAVMKAIEAVSPIIRDHLPHS